MKQRKIGIAITIVLIITMLILSVYNVSNAENETKTLGFVLYRKSGNGYLLGGVNPNVGGVTKIWKLVTYNENHEYNEDDTIYCLSEGVGFPNRDSNNNPIWKDETTSQEITYNYSKNMYTQKDEIIDVWNAYSREFNQAEINSDRYNKILWIIDNMYVPIENNDDLNNQQKVNLLRNAIGENSLTDENLLSIFTDEELDAIQQYAIWRVTNNFGANSIISEGRKNAEFTSFGGQSLNINGYETYSKQTIANLIVNYLVDYAQTNYQGNTNPKYTTTATFWARTNDDTEQPVVVIKRTPNFDLSLRKYITKIENENKVIQDNVRTVTYGFGKLNNMSDDDRTNYLTTTAEYLHAKDPQEVDTGYYVTYTISVYNEGGVEGRATEIKDQLPTGLEFIEVLTDGYTGTVDANTNLLTISESTEQNNLLPYTGDNTLSRKDIQVKCRVTATRGEQEQVLTNIAWISRYTNPLNIDDRDSSTSINPSVNKNSSTYTGNNNKEDLTDTNYYYKGQEDDDDFDKIKIPAREKIFDLSLRKSIISITDKNDATTWLNVSRANAEEINKVRNMTIDTKNLDDDIVTSDYTSTTAEYKHRKDPIRVDTGYKVTYEITIFNEGEIDGRATKIIDQLPEGLTFNREATEGLSVNSGYRFTVDSNNVLIIEETEEHNLAAYVKESQRLSNTKIQVVCDVTQEREDEKITLTNLAWIAEDYNAERKSDIDSDTLAPTISNNSLRTTGEDIGYTGKDTYTTEQELADATNYYKGQQDDDDFDKIVIPAKEKIFDLSLRKYITKVTSQDGKVTNIEGNETTTRNPNIDESTLVTGTTATYKHRKDPVVVNTGDLVTYNITVYNEGEKAGRATEITDQLPTGLTFNKEATENIEINSGYTFVYDAENNKVTISETEGSTHTNIPAYAGSGDPSSNTIQVVCNVVETKGVDEKILTNIAYISEEYNQEDNLIITNQRYTVNKLADRDSEPSTIESKTQEELNTTTIGYTGKAQYNASDLSNKNEYFEGQQDDDDFEKVKLLPDQIDLSLRKFITAVNDKEITSRIPEVDTSTIKTNGTATYNHTKKPLNVKIGDIVTYTIRVYNEGGIDGYVSEITDHLPSYLQFISSANAKTDAERAAAEFNTNYLWENPTDRTIITKIGSVEIGANGVIEKEYSTLTGIDRKTTLLKAFDGGDTLDYLDVKVKCKVVSAVSGTKITNIADITKMQNERGEEVNKDRDSTVKNVVIPNDSDLPSYKDDETDKPYVPGQEDDDDFEKVQIQIFDLALRKFITQIDDESVTTRYPQVTYSEEKGRLVYTHDKNPLGVSTGNLVTYTIRIFNEGDMDGYASEITDNLPEGLLFVPDNKVNERYRWKMLDKDQNETTDVSKAVYITTDYLSKAQEDETGRSNLLKAYNASTGVTSTNPDYRDVKVIFEVIEPNTSDRILINTAQISKDEDENGDEIEDNDSVPNRDETYNFNDEDENEDDIDIEKVKLNYFDLALRKFITAVDDTKITNRVPKLSLDKGGNITYTHTKEPVEVANGNVVTYTIRVFNEGNMNGYANEVTDDMPEGLEFLPENEINKEYRWKLIDKDGKETTDVSKAVKITTDYLSIEQEKATGRNNLIKAYDKSITLSEVNPDYRDVKVAFKVIEPNTSDRILVNTAEISDDKDENGKDVKDKDSTPGNGTEGEDDIDKEYVKVKYFDLALKKWVTQVVVIENGKETITNTGHTGEENPEPAVKVEIKEKSLNKVNVKFVYNIKVTNEGEIAGYAKEVKDHIPEGLEFVKEDNPAWYECEDGTVATAQLENTLLQPGETATVSIVLQWINGSENMGLKTNYAEISKDYNDSNSPDIDSKPNNFKNKPVEDDEDEAPVILSIKTGEAPVYIVLTLGILITLTTGIVLIKKYVL